MIPLIPRERWPYSKQIKLWLDKLLSSSLDLSLGNNFFIYVCLSSCSFVVCFLLSFARYLTSFSNMYVLLNKILHSHGLVNDIYWFLELLWRDALDEERNDLICAFANLIFLLTWKKRKNKWDVKKWFQGQADRCPPLAWVGKKKG